MSNKINWSGDLVKLAYRANHNSSVKKSQQWKNRAARMRGARIGQSKRGSECLDNSSIRGLWECEACGYAFETTIVYSQTAAA